MDLYFIYTYKKSLKIFNKNDDNLIYINNEQTRELWYLRGQ